MTKETLVRDALDQMREYGERELRRAQSELTLAESNFVEATQQLDEAKETFQCAQVQLEKIKEFINAES